MTSNQARDAYGVSAPSGPASGIRKASLSPALFPMPVFHHGAKMLSSLFLDSAASTYIAL